MASSPCISADPTNPEHGYHCVIPECDESAAAKVSVATLSFMLCTKHLGELAGTATAAALRAAFTGAVKANDKVPGSDALDLDSVRLARTLRRGNTVSRRTDGLPTAEGAWFIFNYDGNAYPEGLHTDELEARRLADNLGYHAFVVFWPNGKLWYDVDPARSRDKVLRVDRP